MDADTALVLGMCLAVLSIPSIITASIDRRAPRVSAIVLIAAGGLILYALQTKPSGYTFQDIPHAIIEVIAEYIP